MKSNIAIFFAIALCGLFAADWTLAADAPASIERELETYRELKDVKAFAVSRTKDQGIAVWVSGYSHTYDTPADAVKAALVFCRQSQTSQEGRQWDACRVKHLGDPPLSPKENGDLEPVIRRYAQAVIARLVEEIVQTNNRQALTMLETIYQKLGMYRESKPHCHGSPGRRSLGDR